MERVRTHLHHPAVRLRRVERRRPRSEAVQDEDDVGFLQPWRGVCPRRHRVVGGERELHRPVLHDRYRPDVGDLGECGETGGRSGAALGEDDRIVGRGEERGDLLDQRSGGGDAGRRHRGRQGERCGGAGRAEHFARKADIDRSARGRRRDRIGAVDDVRHLLREAQLVVPFRGLAHQRALVPHFLAPADGHRPCAEPAGFERRRPAGKEQDRHPFRRRVDRAERAVGEADIGVGHHRLGAARRKEIAVRHAHGSALMRYHQGLRKVDALRRGLGETLDEGRKVRAGIGEDVIDADGLEARQKRAACGQLEGSMPVFHPAFLRGALCGRRFPAAAAGPGSFRHKDPELLYSKFLYLQIDGRPLCCQS